ncbi:MAG: nuoL, partial [Proteobacteria bacterium]|nr:nuoL [Pseudomonadota bacterium]
ALSLNMLFVVTGIGFLIHVYSAGYMANDRGYARFFAYMNLFVFAMVVLVLADNLPLLYLGWEGVGLCSYLLIGFWYDKPENGYAARKAFIVTRVGDTAMALGLFLLFAQLDTLDIQTAMTRAATEWQPGSGLAVAAALLLLGGAVGKSAQIPLQVWLPDAMAGPTPISALIHAATMVTAGVYLIARTHTLFQLAPDVQALVGVIGAVTLLISGCTALTQTDIKRILAYSTISQIGYMFLALGAGAWSAAIFHLTTHAFFKALLFLAAGAIILSLHHEQNIFRMGGLRKRLPFAFWTFLIGTAALVALPLTSGYASKHEILSTAYAGGSPGLWAAGTFGALLTGAYSTRLILVTFFGPQRTPARERLPISITTPLALLALLSLVGGVLKMDLSAVLPSHDNHEAGWLIEGITVAAPFLGILVAYPFYASGLDRVARLTATPAGAGLHRFWFSGWGFDRLYGALLVGPFCRLAALNKGDIVDSPFRAVITLARAAHRLLARTQTGRLRWYAAGMVLGAGLMLAAGVWS